MVLLYDKKMMMMCDDVWWCVMKCDVCWRVPAGYLTEHRVLLTGTPLQNRISELWNLLNFAAPYDFPDETSFIARYGNLENSTQVTCLTWWPLYCDVVIFYLMPFNPIHYPIYTPFKKHHTNHTPHHSQPTHTHTTHHFSTPHNIKPPSNY